jgi:hypothetical protein
VKTVLALCFLLGTVSTIDGIQQHDVTQFVTSLALLVMSFATFANQVLR